MSIITCRDKILDKNNKTLVMGILNVTPDSFSDGGVNFVAQDAINNAVAMIEAGVDIIDVGGESTRPGFEQISDEEEINRIVPVISYLSENTDVVISVDTYKPAVAEAALEAGAHIINDIEALHAPDMASVIAKYNAGAVLMYNARLYPCDEESNVADYAREVLSGTVAKALDAGISGSSIILDPGIGFGTTRPQDAQLIRELDKLSLDGKYPVLLALSRKRLVAEVMGGDNTPVQRDETSLGLGIAGVNNGACMLRVHNVDMTVKALKGYDFITRGEN
ncbi:MAG: dihydropteroate synthase [Saccharofermentans sp.]|nr:dihydropteroate synthase [Saccharofermentans sp.]